MTFNRIGKGSMEVMKGYFERSDNTLSAAKSKLNKLTPLQLQDAFTRLDAVKGENGVTRQSLVNAPAAKVAGYELGDVFGAFARFAPRLERVANPPAVTETQVTALRTGTITPARAKTLQRDALTDLFRLSNPFQERSFQDAALAELRRIHGKAAGAITAESVKPNLEKADDHVRRSLALESVIRLHMTGLAPMNHDLLMSCVDQLSRYGRVHDLPVLEDVKAFAAKKADPALAEAAQIGTQRLKKLEHVDIAFVQLEGGQTTGSGVKSYVNPTSEALANQGHHVDVYLPMTGELDPVAKGLKRVEGSEGSITDVLGKVRNFELWTEGDTQDRPNGGRRNVYYFKDDHYFTPREGMYDEAPGKRFDDDAERLMAGAAYVNASMSKVAALRKLESEGAAVTTESVQGAEKRLTKSDVPDAIQYNDSHFGFSHAMLQFNEAFKDTKALGIVHQGNPAYRRWIPREYVEPMLRKLGGEYEKTLEALGEREWVDPLELMANTMAMSTVSTGYLDYLLHDYNVNPRVMGTLQEAHAEGRLSAVQNGIDLEKFNPAVPHDSQAATFSASDLSGRVKNKEALQKDLGLAVDPDAPLLAFAHRMTLEKGLQNLTGEMGKDADGRPITPLDVVLKENPRLQVLLGGPDPDPALLAKAKELEARWPGRVVVKGERLDNRKIMSGADVFLMPSVEEPCGIAQMEAQALGAAVLYLNHHGPKGSVLPYNEAKGTGTGFAVQPGSMEALTDGLRRAVKWASLPAKEKEQLQRNALEYAKTFDVRRMANNHAALMREALTLANKEG